MSELQVEYGNIFSGPWIRIANPLPVSLAMLIHKCHDFFAVSENLADEIMMLLHRQDFAGLEEHDLRRITNLVDRAAKLVASMDGVSPSLREYLRRLGGDLRVTKPNDLFKTPEVIQRDLEHIQTSLRVELEQHHFLYIPSSRAKYLRKSSLFGPSVHKSFPEAREDIKSAGTAFAVELYAACIFHLMRVAEYGLRELGRKLKVQLTDKSKGVPLEYSDWNKVISGVRLNLNAARSLPQGAKKQRNLEMYSRAADHCEYMKDIWRNSISHARGSHSQPDALQAMEHVKGFMQLLASDLLR